MTKNNQEVAFNYCEKTKELKENIEKSFLLLGERLKKIRDEKLYLPVHEAFWCFLEEELKMSESTASRLISTFTKFILDWGIEPEKVVGIGGWNEAYLITKTAKSKKDAEEMIEKFQLMPPSEQRKEIADYKAGGKCEHDWNEIHLRQCRACGLKEKIYDEN